jgi:hypothetical protein
MSRNYRDKNGQFFTSYSQIKFCLSELEKYTTLEYKRILEPSCGTGQFIDLLLNYPDSSLVCIEKDKSLYLELIKTYKYRYESTKLEIINMDFLKYDKDGFDIIIGNPPYVELNDYDKLEYKSSNITGRYNIYGIFVEHAIKLLRNNGLLCFILPPSLMTAPSFQNLRKYIKSECNIKNIIKLDNFNSEVSQDVNIYIFQKVIKQALNNDYTSVYGNLLFSTNKTEQKQSYTILSDHAKVVTGNIVWNQVKSDLEDDKSDQNIRLIYSNDVGHINDSTYYINKNDQKKKYVNTKKLPVKLPAIFITRSKNPKHELVEHYDEPLIAENHVNVIQSDLAHLKLLDEYLKSNQCIKYIKENTGTINFSKTQLENLPIFTQQSLIVFED